MVPDDCITPLLTPEELRQVRQRLGMSMTRLTIALHAYDSRFSYHWSAFYRWEHGAQTIPTDAAHILLAYMRDHCATVRDHRAFLLVFLS